MPLLTVFVISFCLINVSTQAKVEKPDIQVNFTNAGSIDRRVIIECSSKHHSYSSCEFYRNEEITNKPHTQTLEGHVQYIIPHVTEEHEGFYTCECYTNDADHTETSFRAPLILEENGHKPAIEFNTEHNKFTCRSDDMRSSYILCILYKNNQQITDTGTHYTTDGTSHADISNTEIKQGDAFSCQCYEKKQEWTKRSENFIFREEGVNFSVMTIIRLCIGFAVLLLMFIFLAESRWQHSKGGVAKQYLS
ncbi:uncharacterized protein LOC122808951 isoform X2 [Protopterus annectens]|uniref:uncharacterized protein LOC122808951 isoform X2 n=1 Tax=Protopterus annectens TaxID=7888 RepID=UPI001CF9EA23|nr:uncharacterized protein LOC122808951 isoform X2 [Protopterus annectens]